jgi:hypothetical protein
MALIEGFTGFGHCKIYILRITARNFGKRHPGGGVQSRKNSAMTSAVLAVNKGGAREVEICGQRFVLRGC